MVRSPKDFGSYERFLLRLTLRILRLLRSPKLDGSSAMRLSCRKSVSKFLSLSTALGRAVSLFFSTLKVFNLMQKLTIYEIEVSSQSAAENSFKFDNCDMASGIVVKGLLLIMRSSNFPNLVT